MTRWSLVAWLTVAGCGRIGFGDTIAGDGAGGVGDGAGGVGDGSAAGASYAQTVLADQPLAYYRLDEASGTVANDSSGNGYNGRYLVGGTATLALGMTGALAHDTDTAVELIGDGNANQAFVSFPAAVNTFAGDFTIEGWVTPVAPPLGENAAFFVWEVYNTNGLRTGWTHTLAPLLWTNESGGDGAVESPTQFVAGAWNYFAITRAGTTVSIYVAGQLAMTGAPTLLPPPGDANNCYGAAEGIPAGNVYDELAIYSHALDASRIAAHYTAAQ